MCSILPSKKKKRDVSFVLIIQKLHCRFHDTTLVPTAAIVSLELKCNQHKDLEIRM